MIFRDKQISCQYAYLHHDTLVHLIGRYNSFNKTGSLFFIR